MGGVQVQMTLHDPEAGWYVGNTPSSPRLNIPPILMQDAGQGFLFLFSEGPLLFVDFKIFVILHIFRVIGSSMFFNVFPDIFI